MNSLNSMDPPTLDNTRGQVIYITTGCTSALVAVVVFLRLWARYRFSNATTDSFRLHFGSHHLWVFLSDIIILLSFIMAIILTVIACVGVHWGLGIHMKLLSAHQADNALEMFYLYQIFYKFAAGISKIATCLLLLAISSNQVVLFNRFCEIMIVYIAGYCIACSIATVFHCGIDFSSNWDHAKSQQHCFNKPPFWYIHAGLNIFASVIIAGLPWWLFYYISYKRKYVIATLMTMLSLSEIVFGCVRLKGLYISAHSLEDLTYGSVTGITVSQLEVNFGIMSACIPTVLKIMEDFFNNLFRCAFGRERNETELGSRSLKSDVQLSVLNKTVPHKKYTRFGEEEIDLGSVHSGNSTTNIIAKDKNRIKVETSFLVEGSTPNDNTERALRLGLNTQTSVHVDAKSKSEK